MSIMVATIKQTVTVQPGGIIQIRSDQFKPGTQAEVTVRVETPEPIPEPQKRVTWASLRGAGKGCYASAEEVDAFIRSERDAWER
jgi:hypothetical protein